MTLSQKQLKERMHYIGSSDAKIIASADMVKWRDLIDEKASAIPKVFPKAIQNKMNAGSFMEPYVLDEFTIISGIEIDSFQLGRSRVETINGLDVPIHSTYDALQVGGDRVPIEAKCHWGMSSIEDLCDWYSAQCQHHIFSADTDYCYLVAFFGLNAQVQYRKIKRDQEYIDLYLHNAHKFWNWYENDIEPKEAVDALMPAEWTDMFSMSVTELEGYDSRLESEINLNAQSIRNERLAKEDAEKAKIELRHLIPDKCRKLTAELTGNLKGYTMDIIRMKGRESSIYIKKQKMKEAS